MSLTWNEYMKEDALRTYTVELPLNDENKAELALCGDTHLGNSVYDMTKTPMKILKSQLNYIEKNEHIRVMGMGDDMETVSLRSPKHLRNSTREVLVGEEAELYCSLWEDVMPQIIGRVIGNHELRISREWERFGFSGIPMVDNEIMKANPDCILADPERGIILRIKVGDRTYQGYFSHGTGSSIRPDYYLKKVYNVFEGLDFCAMAHIHQTFSQNYPVLVPGRGKHPTRKSRWGIRTGTPTPYLAYAEKKLYPITEPSNMILTFSENRHEVKVNRLMQDRILC